MAQNIPSSSLNHGGGNVLAWAGMVASEADSLIIIENVTHYGSSKKKTNRNLLSENFILTADLQVNASNWGELHHSAKQ